VRRRTVFDFPLMNRDRAFAGVDAMRKISEAHGISVARVALAWLLAQKHVTTIIIGAKNAQQLRDNVEATTLKLTPKDLSALEAVSAHAPEYPWWIQGRR
jgi:aryl-alcohol dehydrogenase-like predicted oxidoreductase